MVHLCAYFCLMKVSEVNSRQYRADLHGDKGSDAGDHDTWEKGDYNSFC